MSMQKQTKASARWQREGAGTPRGAKGDRDSRERSRRTADTETRITESQGEGGEGNRHFSVSDHRLWESMYSAFG